jgi:hypothetical protein
VSNKEPTAAQSTLVINYILMIKTLPPFMDCVCTSAFPLLSPLKRRNKISAVEFNNKDSTDKEIAGTLLMFQKDRQKQTIRDLILQEQMANLRILKTPSPLWEEDLTDQPEVSRLRYRQRQIHLRRCLQLNVDWTGDKRLSSLWMVCPLQLNFHGVTRMHFLVKLQLL